MYADSEDVDTFYVTVTGNVSATSESYIFCVLMQTFMDFRFLKKTFRDSTTI